MLNSNDGLKSENLNSDDDEKDIDVNYIVLSMLEKDIE